MLTLVFIFFKRLHARATVPVQLSQVTLRCFQHRSRQIVGGNVFKVNRLDRRAFDGMIMLSTG